MTPRLLLRNITKRYPSVTANDAVSLVVGAGEIHAVLGENGAGKSTLMKIIAGAVRPDAGAIEFDGHVVAIDSPKAAREMGIAMVFQHFALFDTLTVAENIALGLDARTKRRCIAEQLRSLGQRYGLAVDPLARVHDLSMGERQRAEILRALLTRPRLLILDEPTSVLTPQAVDALFGTIEQLAREGVSVLFISHKLDEIRRLAHRCTVLRGGRVVATVDPREQTEQSLARLMIGADPPQIAAHDTPPGAVRLSVSGLTLGSGPGAGALDFELRAGEIVGVAGISGNGQRELMARLSGEVPAPVWAVVLDHQPIGALSTRARRLRGLRYVPEERMRHGAVPELSLAENTLLTGDELHGRVFVNKTAMTAKAARVIERFDVRCAGPEAPTASLSGGNVQKFIVGREIESAPRVLLVDQPTWGVDVGSTAAIRNALIELRARGAAILVVSEEIDELFEVCDRIMVMANRRLSPAVAAGELSLERLGQWMSGNWVGAGA